MSAGAIKVLCIGGTGQNGATLLSRLLGSMPGFVAVGEIGYVWDKGLIENVDCSCGRAFRECPFWSAVGRAAFGGWDSVDADGALRLRAAVTRLGGSRAQPLSIPLILAPGIRPSFAGKLRGYAELMEALYRGIQDVSGGAVIVDSMKRPTHVYTVRRIEDADLRVVHLVRDPRGVAYSGTKVIERQGGDPNKTHRTRRQPGKSAARWMWINGSFHALDWLGVPVERVRYETLVTSPLPELQRVAALAGVDPTKTPSFTADGEVAVPVQHLVAGNRMRLQPGTLRLALDEEWRAHLAPNDRRMVNLVAWPLMLRYGYVGRPPRDD